jgi:hypothetical protein
VLPETQALSARRTPQLLGTNRRVASLVLVHRQPRELLQGEIAKTLDEICNE